MVLPYLASTGAISLGVWCQNWLRNHLRSKRGEPGDSKQESGDMYKEPPRKTWKIILHKRENYTSCKIQDITKRQVGYYSPWLSWTGQEIDLSYSEEILSWTSGKEILQQSTEAEGLQTLFYFKWPWRNRMYFRNGLLTFYAVIMQVDGLPALWGPLLTYPSVLTNRLQLFIPQLLIFQP